jgi:hypothetical protein
VGSRAWRNRSCFSFFDRSQSLCKR